MTGSNPPSTRLKPETVASGSSARPAPQSNLGKIMTAAPKGEPLNASPSPDSRPTQQQVEQLQGAKSQVSSNNSATPTTASQAKGASQQVNPNPPETSGQQSVNQTGKVSVTSPEQRLAALDKQASNLIQANVTQVSRPPKPSVSQSQTSVIQLTVKGQVFDLTLPAHLSTQQRSQLLNASEVVLSQHQAQQVLNHAAKQSLVSTSLSQSNSNHAKAQSGSANIKAANQISSQVLLLAQAIIIKLPESLQSLAQQNGVSQQQLAQLASRPQGYPLPVANVEGKHLTFAQGASIKLNPQTQLPSGDYLAKVVISNKSLSLQLTPIKADLSVQLTPRSPLTATASQVDIVISKHEPAQLMAQMMQKLDKTPLTQPQQTKETPLTNKQSTGTTVDPKLGQPTAPLDNKAKLSAVNSSIQNVLSTNAKRPDGTVPVQPKSESTIAQAKLAKVSAEAQASQPIKQQTALSTQQAIDVAKQTTDKLKGNLTQQTSNNILLPSSVHSKQSTSPTTQSNTAPIDVLQKALDKAGAIPKEITTAPSVKVSLASELLKLLPQLGAQPLSSLAEPSVLKSELLGLAAMQLAQPQSTSSQIPLVSGSAITTLFQLLLGVRAQSINAKLSAKLSAHIQRLQQQLGTRVANSTQLLTGLDKAGSLETVSQVGNGFSLYQQASSDPSQNAWFFAMPYTVNQKQEQFEGKFEHEEDEQGQRKGWRLQLKFNIAQGAMIVIAHKHGDKLDLTVQGNNQSTLDKVQQHQQALMDKITAIGFEAGQFTTQIKSIPATLLPGDHFLVKTHA
ncbi:hypothetical protein [Shewanella maritima]|uniref:hypothetical protein n=1 Tax=Shewanella maritima TaxID=2520507 RepID=UPI003735C107